MNSGDKLTKLFLDFGQELNGYIDELIKLRGKMKIGLDRQRERLSSWTVDGSETVFKEATYSVQSTLGERLSKYDLLLGWDVENDECWIRDINSDGWETKDDLILGFTRLFLDKEWSNELGTTFDESTFANYVRNRYGVSTVDELSGDDKVKLFEWLRVAFNDMKSNMERILQNMRSGRNELKNFLDSELKSFVEQRMKFVYELMFAEMVDMAITIDENALRENPYLCNGNFEKWYDTEMQKDNDFVKEFTFKLGKVYQIYNEEC
jgi:hypothetical protein